MSATPFRTRKLGRTTVFVSELGLGTAPIGDLFDKVEDDEAAGLVAAAWDGGVRYFDTSTWCGRGQAEHRLGWALLNTIGSIPRFLDLFDIDFFLMATRYTLLETDVLDGEFPRCAERGVGIVIGGGYNSGILATGAVPGAMYNYAPASPAVLDWVAKIERVCARHNAPIAAAALQFPLGHAIVASIVPGAISVRQVEQNLAAFRHPIPADLWAELKREKLLRADAPVAA